MQTESGFSCFKLDQRYLRLPYSTFKVSSIYRSTIITGGYLRYSRAAELPAMIAAQPPTEHNCHIFELLPAQKPLNRRPGESHLATMASTKKK